MASTAKIAAATQIISPAVALQADFWSPATLVCVRRRSRHACLAVVYAIPTADPTTNPAKNPSTAVGCIVITFHTARLSAGRRDRLVVVH